MHSAPSPPPGSDDVLEDSAGGAGGTLPANWWDASQRPAGGGGGGGLGGIVGSAGSLSDAGAGFVGLKAALGGVSGGADRDGDERLAERSALAAVKAAMVTADCEVAPSALATSAASADKGAAYWQVRHRGDRTKQSSGRASETKPSLAAAPHLQNAGPA